MALSHSTTHRVGNVDIEIVPQGPGYEGFVRIIRSDYAWDAVSINVGELPGVIGILTGAHKLFADETPAEDAR